MMRFLSLALLAGVFTVGSLVGAEPKITDAVKCPVSGKGVDAAHAVDYMGGKVYFCCPNCPKEFAKNTEKYAAKAKAQLLQTGQIKQIACPLTGRPVNETKSAEVAGVKVGLCCGGCQAKMDKADDATKLDLAFGPKSGKGYEAVK